MKLLLTAIVLISSQSFARGSHVSGHYRSNGTYVQPYQRSESNSTKLDNFSTKGNINPYTGKKGTKIVDDE